MSHITSKDVRELLQLSPVDPSGSFHVSMSGAVVSKQGGTPWGKNLHWGLGKNTRTQFIFIFLSQFSISLFVGFTACMRDLCRNTYVYFLKNHGATCSDILNDKNCVQNKMETTVLEIDKVISLLVKIVHLVPSKIT